MGLCVFLNEQGQNSRAQPFGQTDGLGGRLVRPRSVSAVCRQLNDQPLTEGANAMLSKFAIPLVGSATDHALRILELDSLLESRPERLLLVLTGSGGLQADAVMAYLDLLSRAECEIAIVSYSNLYGADFALWLAAGAVREIRPRAWVYMPAQIADSGEDVGGTTVMAPGSAMRLSWDYESCLKIVSEHVALDLVLGHRLSSEDLRELLLMPSDDLDRMLMPEVAEGGLLPEQSQVPPRTPNNEPGELL